MADEKLIGTHRLHIEGDTVLTRWIGTPSLDDVRQIHEQIERVIAEHGRVFLMNDMRQSGIPSAQTRQWIAKCALNLPVTGIVNFGASLPIRVLQTLILRASALLGSQPSLELVHCGSEAEAFAWVAARRRTLP